MIKLTVPVPPSVNAAFGNRRGAGKGRYKTKAYKAWETDAIIALRGQTGVQITYPCRIDYTVPKNRRRDLDNHLKLLNDLLVNQGIIWDDRSQYVRHLSIAEGEDRTDVLIEIRELE